MGRARDADARRAAEDDLRLLDDGEVSHQGAEYGRDLRA
jgi:hypothetical protein